MTVSCSGYGLPVTLALQFLYARNLGFTTLVGSLEVSVLPAAAAGGLRSADARGGLPG